MIADANLYDSPRAPLQDATPADPASTRAALLAHEASIVGMGKLQLVSGILLLSVAIGFSTTPVPGLALVGMLRLMLLGCHAFGTFQFVLGLTLWTRHPMARPLTTAFGVLHLMSVPIGTIIGGYLLWLTHGAAGSVILSPAYAAVRRATPELRLPGSLWGGLALLLSVPTALSLCGAGLTYVCGLLTTFSP